MIELSIEGIYNARAVARHAQERARGQSLAWLVRSATLDHLTPAGEHSLRRLGVDLVVDLRESTEQGARTHGLPVAEVPLYGATPPVTGNLEHIYVGLLRDRGRQMTEAITRIAEHPGVAAVHCTAGKDRTGLIIAVARLAAGDELDEIVEDYSLSGAPVRAVRASTVSRQLDALSLSDIERAQAERLHLDSPAEALMQALAWIERCGGAHEYLLTNGATKAHLRALREKTKPSAQGALVTAR